MKKPKLTKEIAYKALQDFYLEKPFVLFATGTSCAVDLDFGMPALEAFLKDEIPKKKLTKTQLSEWNKVIIDLENNINFETAMDSINEKELLKIIIDKTAELVASIDKKHMVNILKGDTEWTALSILKPIVDKLPESDRVLHVATPNYDMLAEYAFSYAEIPYNTGFWGSVIKILDWKQSERQMSYKEIVPSGRNKTQSITCFKKHIKLYKVHGSLNTFNFNNKIIETEIWRNTIPNVERIMITPGSLKYEKLHNFRSELLSGFDASLQEHRAFLFLGFGFNDTQLVNNIIYDKLKNQDSHALIITRDLNERIEKLLNKSKNTWIVCKKEDDDMTRIFNSRYSNWLYLNDKELWKFDKFAKEILGV